MAERVKIKMGDWFRSGRNGPPYILASVGESKMELISPMDGNRYHDGEYVANPKDISDDEFNRITSNTMFTRITKPREIIAYNNTDAGSMVHEDDDDYVEEEDDD